MNRNSVVAVVSGLVLVTSAWACSSTPSSNSSDDPQGGSGREGPSGSSSGANSGSSGVTGKSGSSGKSDTSGASGKSGTSGASGKSGTSGASGKSGTSGASGKTDAGRDGDAGDLTAACPAAEVADPPTVSPATNCNFTADVPLGAEAADGMVDVPPDHPMIRYVGRVDCTAPKAPKFAFPGVSIAIHFTGTSLDLRLKDQGSAVEKDANYLDVIIDDGEPIVVRRSPTVELYPISHELSAGEHTAVVWHRGESGGKRGITEFLGFRVRKDSKLQAVAARARTIEFVGDSITCGYGNLVSTTTPDESPYTMQNSNARLAFGARAAEMLSANYYSVAYSGRGMYRNFGGAAGDPVPAFYLKTLPDGVSSDWDVTRAPPEVVVINLGTNDFSPAGASGGVDHQAYRCAYAAFLSRLRRYYPKATLVATLGPMMSDDYPAGEDALTNARTIIQQVVAARRAAGDEHVAFFEFDPQSPPYGEDWHPTVATHEAMAKALVAFLKPLQGW